MRVGTAFWEKYKHYKGKSKYFRGENNKKVKKLRKFEANNTHKNKLGLSWAKLSCQLGFGCTVINICYGILIYLK